MTERDDDIRFAGASAAGETSGDPDAIRSGIEGTRERLGNTLEQLGDRLNPRTLAAQVKDSVRGASLDKAQAAARDAADRVSVASEPALEKARQYPLPAVAIAAGIGWLLAGRSRRSAERDIVEGMSESGREHAEEIDYATQPDPLSTRSAYPSAPLSGASSSLSTGSASSTSSTSGVGASALSSSGLSAGTSAGTSDFGSSSSRGSIDDWSPAGSSTAYDDRVELDSSSQGSASQLTGGVRSAVGGAGSRVKEVGGAVAAQTRDLPRRVADRARANPVQMGVATLAAGLAAGFAVPATNREVELMGDQRDQLVDRVRGAVQQTRERAKQAAGEVVQQTKTAATQALHGQGPSA